MSSVERLITAMHTAGVETPRSCREWIDLTQQHSGLLEAMHGAFGKRLPIPAKLGLWLSKRCGETAGELILQGRYSLRKKGWIYRVAPKPKPVPPVEQPALVPLVQQPASVPPLPLTPTHIDDGYLSTVKYDSEGKPRMEYTRDRDGNPIPARRGPTEPPPKAPEPDPAGDPTMPPWVQRGELQAKNKAEWQAWQNRRTPAHGQSAPVSFDGNGVDFSAGPNGVRLRAPTGALDDWRYNHGGNPNWTKLL